MENLLEKPDPSEKPEVYECLRDYAEYGFSPMNLVCDLVRLQPVTRRVWDFVFELLEAEVAAGNTEAMNELGMLYHDGIGCEVDFDKAVALFRMAAEHGDRHAYQNLGYCYYYGRNMPVDYEKAYHCFILGALDGNPVSLYKIGDMYMNGYYVPKDETQAFRIYENCRRSLGDEATAFAAGPVYLRLGSAYLEGRGTGADLRKALQCFQKAEIYLYNMVMNGDFQYKKSLFSAIEGQQKAREALLRDLPEREWTYDS